MGRFRAVFAARNLCFGTECPTPCASLGGRAIDAKPSICYHSNRSRGEISRIVSLSPFGRGEGCGDAG